MRLSARGETKPSLFENGRKTPHPSRRRRHPGLSGMRPSSVPAKERKVFRSFSQKKTASYLGNREATRHPGLISDDPHAMHLRRRGRRIGGVGHGRAVEGHNSLGARLIRRAAVASASGRYVCGHGHGRRGHHSGCRRKAARHHPESGRCHAKGLSAEECHASCPMYRSPEHATTGRVAVCFRVLLQSSITKPCDGLCSFAV